MPKVAIVPNGMYSAKPMPPVQYGAGLGGEDSSSILVPFGRDSYNILYTDGYLKSDYGFKVVRQVTTGTASKAAGSWTHLHTDGTEFPFYYWNTAIYRETGSGATSIASSLTETFVPSVAHFGNPNGWSIFLNGTNGEAQVLRKETNLAAVLYDLPVIGGSILLGNASASGGSLSDDTYDIRVTQLDDTGATTVESVSFDASSITLSGGGSAQTFDVQLASATYASRATKYRVYISTAGDVLTAFFQTGASTVKATTTLTITATGTATLPLANRNGFERQATMPLTGARIVVNHQRRAVIASTASPVFYWSQKDATNHYYSTNGINSAKTGLTSSITAMIGNIQDTLIVWTKKGTYAVHGDFSYNTTSNTHDVRVEPIDPSIGCVGHGTVAEVPGWGVLFMSQYGPARLDGGRVDLLLQDDIKDLLDCLDWTYAPRWTAAFDPVTRMYVLCVGRKTNSTRAMDGQSVTGFNDIAIRFSTETGKFQPLMLKDVVHLSVRHVPDTVGTESEQDFLTGMGPHASADQFNFGYAGGDADGVVTSTDNNGKLAASSTTTSVTYGQAGISDNALVGQTVTLFYPTVDTGFPGVVVQKEISSNTTSGGSLTINWVGALTVPTSTEWTVRISGLLRQWDVRSRLHPDPRVRSKVTAVTIKTHDIIGAESL